MAGFCFALAILATEGFTAQAADRLQEFVMPHARCDFFDSSQVQLICAWHVALSSLFMGPAMLAFSL